MIKVTIAALIAIVALSMGSLSGRPGGTWYLMRTSPIIDDLVHVATFDANESGSYNKDNCLIAQQLFQNQPDVLTKFICTKSK